MKGEISSLVAHEEGIRCLVCHEPPCSTACPVRSQPGRFLQAVRFRDEQGAAQMIRRHNVFAAACSILCREERYCERACVRNKIGSPVAIRKVHQYVMEQEGALRYETVLTEKTVLVWVDCVEAVIVCGCLQRMNYAVTAFSKKPLEAYFETHVRPLALKDINYMRRRGLTVETAWNGDLSGYDTVILPEGETIPGVFPEPGRMFTLDYKVLAEMRFIRRMKQIDGLVQKTLEGMY
jgi:hypothetical protein